MAYDLEKDIYRLLIQEPFFAAVSRHIEKVPCAAIPTAGVRILDDGRFELMYNQKFFEALKDRHRIGILKHEFYHLIFEHCFQRSPDGKKISQRWNIATDMSINCHIKNEIPTDKERDGIEGVLPESFGYEDGLSAEAYYEKLEKDGKGGGGKCNGQHQQGEGEGNGEPCDCGNMDSHDNWGEGEMSGELKELAKERLREALREGMKEAEKNSNGYGNMPADVRKQIVRFVNGTVDWKAVLRQFIGQSQRSSRVNTVKRINRRFPYIHAGKKTLRNANIAISIDQSGSVSDELLSLFYAELDNLAKLASFTIIPFDTRVGQDKIYVWKKGERRPKERVMCGGTDFDAPTKYVNEHPEFDGHIILTDMQAPVPKPSRVRRMWMTDMEGAESPYFKTNERVIPIKRKAR